MNEKYKEALWFNISVIYSAISAGYAAELQSFRLPLVFLAVHGGLWAIFRAMRLVALEMRSHA